MFDKKQAVNKKIWKNGSEHAGEKNSEEEDWQSIDICMTFDLYRKRVIAVIYYSDDNSCRSQTGCIIQKHFPFSCTPFSIVWTGHGSEDGNALFLLMRKARGLVRADRKAMVA